MRNVEGIDNVDPIMFGLSIPGTTFLARAYAGQPAQLQRLVTEALTHSREGKGMGFVEVLSPCVTYNDNYRAWRTRVYDIDSEEEYDSSDKTKAFIRMAELRGEGRLPLGLIYRGEHPSLEGVTINHDFKAPALHNIEEDRFDNAFDEALKSYMA